MSKNRILIVEDEGAIAKMIAMNLKVANYETKIYYDGAEDYIVKPFEMLELLVRIDMVLKRTGKSEEVISLGCITLNMKKRTVQKSGENISLTPMEYDLLCVLAKNRNIALNREKLLREIWGVDFEGETRTVDVHVAALRRKTGLHIVSVPKIGYRLEVDEA